MEKFKELLNEFEKTLEPNLQIEWTEVGIKSTPEIVISKKFGFIKWLVENDNIDLRSNRFIEKEEHYFGEQPDFTFQSVKYTHLLMLLSISDTPIEDLISYLK